jgi:ribosomal protein S14
MEGEDLWQDDDLMSTHLKVILEEPTAADTEVPTHHAWPSRDTLSTSPGNKTQTAKGKGSSVITQEIESMDEEELVSEEDDEFEDEIEEVVVNAKDESPGHGQKQNGRGGSHSPSDSSNLQNHHSHPQSNQCQEPMYTAQDVIRSLRIGRFNFREVVSLVKAAADAIENPCPPEEQASLGNSRTNATVNNMVDHGQKGTVRKSEIKTIPNCHPIIIPPSTSRKRKSTTGSNSLSFKGKEDHFQPR